MNCTLNSPDGNVHATCTLLKMELYYISGPKTQPSSTKDSKAVTVHPEPFCLDLCSTTSHRPPGALPVWAIAATPSASRWYQAVSMAGPNKYDSIFQGYDLCLLLTNPIPPKGHSTHHQPLPGLIPVEENKEWPVSFCVCPYRAII